MIDATNAKALGWTLTLGLALLLLAARPGHAQEQEPMADRWAPVVGIDADYQTVLVGVEGRFENRSILDGIPLQMRPGVHVYVLTSGVVFSADGNVHYRIPIEDNDTGITPYAGGGLSVRYRSNRGTGGDDVSLGINVVGGATYETGGRGTPFLELRTTISDRGTIALMGGYLFEL